MSRCPSCSGTGKECSLKLDDKGIYTASLATTECVVCSGSEVDGLKPKDLRDLFAAAALSNYRLISCNEATAAADWAYTYADAMMERRKR